MFFILFTVKFKYDSVDSLKNGVIYFLSFSINYDNNYAVIFRPGIV